MLSRLSLDPTLMQKRLGDGFYEQKLVNEQIMQQTGQCYLGQYSSAVVFHSGANNAIVTDYYLKQANMNANTSSKYTYRNSPYDFVPNVIGLNGNPLEMFVSTISIPALFADPLTSPHTLPFGWRPAVGNVQGGRP